MPQLSSSSPHSLPPVRVSDALDEIVRQHPDRPAMRAKRSGVWQVTTWNEYRSLVRQAARSFARLGVEPGDSVCIIGANRPEWFIANVGAIHAGGMPAGIYTTNTADQCAFVAAHCDARVVIVENDEQLAKFVSVRDRLPALKALVLVDGLPTERDVYSWDAFLRVGQSVAESEIDARIAAQKPDDVCTLVYTSGTTGSPKGVMLTHDNLTWTARAGVEMIGIGPTDDAISYLPLSHIAEQITTLHGSMASGCCVWFAESIDALGDNLREVRPTFFLGVPRVWEKIQEKMQAAGAKNPPMKKRIAKWARGVGLAAGYADQARAPKPMLYPVAKSLVFSKVREALGLDRARVLVTSAAPISRATLEFFLSLDLPICEVYGMSECSGPATISTPDAYVTGTCGVALPGAELMVAQDGEICMRGRHVFKGYHKDPAATAEALDAEGWLHSGDIGTIDARGYLQITDRKKELIITAGGENIAPQLVEGHIKSIPVVSQAVVIGDRQRYLTVLLTLDPVKVPEVARSAGCTVDDVPSALKDERFMAYLQSEIDRVNGNLARVQTVKKFAVLEQEFTVEGGELTPTMKLRRKVIEAKYRDQIERLYS